LDQIDKAAGQVYNVGGGPDNTLSVWTELGPMLERLVGHSIPVDHGDWRPGDQRIFVADIRKAHKELGWQPGVGKVEGVQKLYQWVIANRSLFTN
jgi:CDP-paratose 2-epimerase